MVESGYGTNELPPIAGSYRGRSLLVCGDAACIWRDLEGFGARDDGGPRGRVRREGWDILTVNKLVETFPGNIEHVYSNEPHILDPFLRARRNEYIREFDGPKHRHSCNRGDGYHVWPLGGHGTSGLGAVLTGIGLGYDRIVICGIPLDDSGHNGEPPWRRGNFTREAAPNVATGVNSHWARAIKFAFAGKVKSMSGRTRDWMGGPCCDWKFEAA
jgi:hypothetical protein